MGVCSSSTQDDILINGVKPITIDTETWKRDSHGLFDYETNDVLLKSLKVPCNSKFRGQGPSRILENKDGHYTYMTNIVRDGTEIGTETPVEGARALGGHTVDHIENNLVERSQIAFMLYKEGQHWIYHKSSYNKDDDFITNPENLIWYTIRDYRNSASSLGYKLKKGDILKFGRARLRVIDINFEEKTLIPGAKLNEQENQNACLPSDFFVSNEDLEEKPTCRICFQEENEDNVLISP